MIVGTAGHIDHGKTSLVKALTQVDTDRLKEEKARGISIDLGFAYLPLPDNPDIILGFVDVPGHEKFIHTMLAGAASIDFVMLVVAADDGVMPQTREHLAIIDLLGVSQGVAVITKTDLASPARIAKVEADIRAELSATTLAAIPIMPVSTLTGAGVPQLQAALALAARGFEHRHAVGRFRLAVDRSFTIQGIGTVVTGSALSGSVRVGDQLIVSPSGTAARVRSLHAQNRESEVGQAGDRCALNLTGDGVSKEAIGRGDMVVASSLHSPADRIDATLRLLASERKPLGQWFPARLHHASTEVGARIVLLGDEDRPGAEDRVQLVLDRPIAAAAGDRYVIRDVSARRTIGGGRFLDLRAPQRKRRSEQRLAQLAAHALADPVATAKALLAIEPYHLDAPAFLRDRALPEDVAAFARDLDAVMLPHGASTLLMLPPQWQSFRAALLERLALFHADHPDLAGLGLERLRQSLQPRLPASAFRAAINRMIAEGLVALDGAWLRLRGHEATMSDADEALWQRMAPLISGEARFRPLRVRDIAGALAHREADIRHLLKLASRMGRAHEVAQDRFFLRGTIAEMVGILVAMDANLESGWFTAACFRDHVNSGRKVAIHILEFFDRNSVTIRRGDRRRLNRQKLDLFGDLTQADTTSSGRESSLVGRPDFKSGRGR